MVLGERFHNSSQNKNQINQAIQKAQEDLSKQSEKDEKSESENGESGDGTQQDNTSETEVNGDENEQSSDEQGYDDKGENPEDCDKTPKPNSNENQAKETGIDSNKDSESQDNGRTLKSAENDEDVESCEEGLDIKNLLKIKGKKKKKLYGKRVDSTTLKGKYVKSKLPKDLGSDIAIDATLRAAAISSEGTITVKSEDIRHKVRKHGAKASIAIVVDISGSMYSEKKSERVKDILTNVIDDASRNGDKVSVVGFKGRDAVIIIPTTKRASSFKEQVGGVKIGGTTPLASGMKRGFEILKKEKFRDEYVPMMLILTDGMPNVAIDKNPAEDAINIAAELKENEIHTIIVNFEQAVKYGRDLNMELAVASGGRYYDSEQLKNPGCAISMILDNERSEL